MAVSYSTMPDHSDDTALIPARLQRLVASVAAGLALLRRAEGALAVAMSGSGPSLFGLFADLEAARAAEAALAVDLADAGLQSWCCRCTDTGASLECDEPVR